LALVEKGELLERMFDFSQSNEMGLVVEWNKTDIVSTLLSDIYYCGGDMALSRRFAYEGYIASGKGNGRLLKRLATIGIIVGEEREAQKYLDILKNTLFYREWALKIEKALRSGSFFAKNREMAYNRECIPGEDQDILIDNFGNQMERLSRANPANKEAVAYRIATLLLRKDLNGVVLCIDELKSKLAEMKIVPYVQQALLAKFEGDYEKWVEYGISASTVHLYNEYKETFKRNCRYPGFKDIMQDDFGKTYWFYLQFK
jgi:hypothetical protein